MQLVEASDATGAEPRCWGTRVGSSVHDVLVLTAAHCVADRAGKPLYVRGATGAGAAFPVLRTWIHPRHDARERSSAHDLALLSVAMPRAQVAAAVIGDAALPRTGALSIPRLREGAIEWVPARRERADTLTLAVGAAHLCQGYSGAPVLVVEEGRTRLVAVVSRGPRDCDGRVMATRTATALAELITPVARGEEPRALAPSCGQCLDMLPDIEPRCVTPLSRCRTDPSCHDFAQAIYDCDGSQETRCGELLAAPAATTTQGALARCLCHSRCREPCASICARSAGATD